MMKIIITDHARDQFSKRVQDRSTKNDVLRAVLTWKNIMSYSQGRVTKMILESPDGILVRFILKEGEQPDSFILKTCYPISPLKFRNIIYYHCQKCY